MNNRRIDIRQIINFGIVGCIATAIDYGLMLLLTEAAGMNYLISCTISFSVSVIFNYILSVRLVFKATHKTSRCVEIAVFIVLSILGLGLNEIIMWCSVELLCIDYRIAKLGATAIVMVYNYLSRKKFLER